MLKWHVCYAPSLAGEILERAVECFTQMHPAVRIELLDCSSEEMLTGLRAGLGVALIGEEAVQLGRGKLVGRKLRPAPVPVRVALGLPAHRETDPVLAAFLEEVCRARSGTAIGDGR